jgi:hydroxymethylglutaryl-CoA lyase
MVAPLDGLPRSVTVYEVGPRDGLQNESVAVPPEVKVELVRRLAAAGLRTVEIASFVRPDLVPQMADAEVVVAAVLADPTLAGLRLPVLVPNERGLDRALGLGVREVAVFASATETFSRRNLNRSVADALAQFAPVLTRAGDAGVAARGYLSMCFGDPWEGPVPAEQVVAVGLRLLELGCHELSLGDTIGVATPGQVVRLLDAFAARGVGPSSLAVHFHDTYGQALANTLVALRAGVTTVDASAGGLGGCPFAGSATGNLATEDLVWQLDGLGITTGIDVGSLVATSTWMAEQLGRPSPSRTVQALMKGPAA